MKTTEKVPCICENGALEVQVATYGVWKVETLLAACSDCGFSDIGQAREAQKATPRGEGSK